MPKCDFNKVPLYIIHFIFNEKFYKQVYGVAVGSPLCPTVADVFLV